MITNIQNSVFSKQIENLGIIHLRPLDLEKDIDTLYDWVTKPYAKYWGMLENSKEEVAKSYESIVNSPHHHAFIGILENKPIFLMEQYKASEDIVGQFYEAKPNDYGMHILVAPAEKSIHNFTWHIFSTIMEYFFSLPFVDRVVVEPDVNNEKIHILNKKAGFEYEKQITLPNKTAALAFCTHSAYKKAIKQMQLS